MIEFREADFSVDEALKELKSPEIGAVVFYVGVVRNGGVKELRKLYGKGAEKEMEELESEAKRRFGVERILLILRPGSLKVEENVLLIGVASAHRGEAFQAARFLIDGIKQAASIQVEEIR
jgi:molybdopterin synthase catalytic subunit